MGAIMKPAVMTRGSDIIAIAPATHPNDEGAAGDFFGGGAAAERGGGGSEGMNRSAAAAGGAGVVNFCAGRAVSDR